MENSMYYTLSTISQVLAAFIALSGVFVLFKLQELDRVILDEVVNLIYYLKNRPAINIGTDYGYCTNAEFYLDRMIRVKNITGLKGQINIIISNENTKSVAFHKQIDNSTGKMLRLIDSKRNLKLITIISILVGVVSIIYSISLLSFVHRICELYSQSLLTIGIISTSISIIFMTIAILRSLAEKFN